MTQLSIRQSGGAAIVSLPKAVLKTLGLDVGSSLDLTIKGQSIVLSPFKEEDTLESLLAGSPKENLVASDEDRVWIEEKSIGKEII